MCICALCGCFLLSNVQGGERKKHVDFVYVSEAIYGYIVWDWEESPLTPTHGEFFYANSHLFD